MSISHLFRDESSSEETWWKGEVVDVDVESEDKFNPNFFVLYSEEAMDPTEVDSEDYFLVPLMSDYLNGCLHFT